MTIRTAQTPLYTEGPWKVVTTDEDIDYKTIIDENDFWVAKVCNFGDEDDLIEARANAHLIAAAPKLLEALKATLNWMQNEAIPTIKCQQIVKTIDAAIAKAEGRTL